MIRTAAAGISFIILCAAFLASCAAGNGSLRCNLYVIDEMNKKEIWLPRKDANEIDSYMKKSSKWKLIPRTANGRLDHAKAYEYAKAGKTVIASYNTGTSANGHVAIVNGKKPMAWSKGYKAYVPYATGSVRGRDPETTTLAYQFSADKEPRMSYFVYDR
ncbi:MAG: hypothetical protein FWC57_04250 [Endomicrobia bacterium]|nr:hypothetical protein [Endomicrobiia bacterium]